MNDQSLNPYASPVITSAESRPRRPVGTVAIAVLLMLLGLATGAGWVLRTISICAVEPSFLMSVHGMKHWILGIFSIAAVSASIGLLSGHRRGWWIAVAFGYFGFALLIVMPLSLRGMGELGPRRLANAGMFLGYWLYLQSRAVLAYYGLQEARRWRGHAALFVCSVIVVFGFVIW